MMRHAFQSGSRDPWAGTIPHEAVGRRGTRLLARVGGAEDPDGSALDSPAGPLPLPSAPAGVCHGARRGRGQQERVMRLCGDGTDHGRLGRLASVALVCVSLVVPRLVSAQSRAVPHAGVERCAPGQPPPRSGGSPPPAPRGRSLGRRRHPARSQTPRVCSGRALWTARARSGRAWSTGSAGSSCPVRPMRPRCGRVTPSGLLWPQGRCRQTAVPCSGLPRCRLSAGRSPPGPSPTPSRHATRRLSRR